MATRRRMARCIMHAAASSQLHATCTWKLLKGNAQRVAAPLRCKDVCAASGWCRRSAGLVQGRVRSAGLVQGRVRSAGLVPSPVK
jgi:hypothetical protein